MIRIVLTHVPVGSLYPCAELSFALSSLLFLPQNSTFSNLKKDTSLVLPIPYSECQSYFEISSNEQSKNSFICFIKKLSGSICDGKNIIQKHLILKNNIIQNQSFSFTKDDIITLGQWTFKIINVTRDQADYVFNQQEWSQNISRVQEKFSDINQLIQFIQTELIQIQKLEKSGNKGPI